MKHLSFFGYRDRQIVEVSCLETNIRTFYYQKPKKCHFLFWKPTLFCPTTVHVSISLAFWKSKTDRWRRPYSPYICISTNSRSTSSSTSTTSIILSWQQPLEQQHTTRTTIKAMATTMYKFENRVHPAFSGTGTWHWMCYWWDDLNYIC